jgi:PAS domain S-box-containing protein
MPGFRRPREGTPPQMRTIEPGASIGAMKGTTSVRSQDPSILADEGRFKHLAENASDVVYLYRVEPDPGFVYVSPSSTRITGYSPDDHYEDPDLFARMAHPHDQDLASALVRSPTSFPEPVMIRFIHSNGEVVWTEHRIAPIFDGTSRVVAIEGVARDVTERVGAENELWRTVMTLRRSEEERERLLRLLVQTEKRERARLAADLHDDTIQVLMVAIMRLDVLRRTPLVDWAQDEVGGIQGAIQEAAQRLRSLIFELSPLSLESDGLAVALSDTVNQLRRDTSLDCTLAATIDREPEPEVRAGLYRMALEALANVRRHADATRVDVLIEDDELGYHLRVQDDGKGFEQDGDAAPGHLGLSGMLERAELLRGRCDVRTSPGEGTTVEVWVPRQAA